MSLAIDLVAIGATFLGVLTAVIVLAFRERHLSERLTVDDAGAERASDRRVMIAIFGSMTAGMLLTLVTAAVILGSI
jgi:hypothetical protein